MASTYDIGDTVRMTGTFTDTGGLFIDPTVVNLWIKAPSSTVLVVTTTALTNISTGVWTYDQVIDSTGVWNYRLYSTGTVVTSEDYWFIVASPLVASTGT